MYICKCKSSMYVYKKLGLIFIVDLNFCFKMCSLSELYTVFGKKCVYIYIYCSYVSHLACIIIGRNIGPHGWYFIGHTSRIFAPIP